MSPENKGIKDIETKKKNDTSVMITNSSNSIAIICMEKYNTQTSPIYNMYICYSKYAKSVNTRIYIKVQIMLK